MSSTCRRSVRNYRTSDIRETVLTIPRLVILEVRAQRLVPTWKELIGDLILSELHLKFSVNFSARIFDVIAEGQQFERHGFRLDPVIRRAIMRKESLHRDVERVTQMVECYNRIVGGLTPAEVMFDGWISHR